MIVPMKKVALIVQSKDADSTILKLRSLGVLHVEHQQPPQGKDINQVQENLSLINNAIVILAAQESLENLPSAEKKESGDWKITSRHIIDLYKRLDQLQEYSRNLSSRISEWEAWGNFDPQQILALAEKNIFINLYQIPAKELKTLPQGIIIKKLFIARGITNCAIISRGKIDLPFKQLELPKTGLEKMRARLNEDSRVIHSIHLELEKQIPYLESLKRAKKNLEKELEFHEALRGMGEAENLSYLAGYIPYDAAEKLTTSSKREKWGLLISEPSEDDNVPTLIRNPRWVSIIKPMFRLLEIIPGYHELDISLAFLVFFSVFFGILIGDAGYGLVYALLTLFVHRKIGRKAKDKTPFFLFYLLSACAMLWGLFTGSFFGQDWLGAIGFRPLLPVLNDPKFMQALCFFLGAFHLSIAHVWRAALKFPSWSAVSDLGWICVLWSAFLFAKMLILSDTLPFFAMWLLWCGIAMVVLFSSPQKNIFKGIGQGFGTLALSLMNNFTDVVSYVRLFAVGMAGLAIAQTANAMAGGVNKEGVLGVIVSAVILVIGHGLNIVLGPVSVLVHGVRLNVLEFSGHANLTWSGIQYKPLQQET